MPAAQPACLLIADISGYTKYLSGVELDHADDIIADLIGTVVKGLQPQFSLAGLEGDAVFVYSPTDHLDGSLLLDLIESTYFNFRRRLESIFRASYCECNACQLLPTLDLKIVVHHGLAIRHEIVGRQELLGSDVILVHRLLKNQLKETLGMEAYAFMTDACIQATTLQPERLSMVRYCEDYDVGEVCGWAHDLQTAWQRQLETRRVVVSEQEAMVTVSTEIPAPPGAVFELISSPRHRPSWSPDAMRIAEFADSSRRGIGTVNHCQHGDGVVVEEILDYRPPDYWTVRFEMPGAMVGMMTDTIEPHGDGSRVTVRMRLLEPVDDPARREMVTAVTGVIEGAMAGLAGYVSDHPVTLEAVDLPPTDEAARLATAVKG
jgi:uncharacterized protein YndB with AHSA1/START domain